ncbi:MAG: hypothetical protein RJB62_344 [Pseudomonadota bacterium]|jgi:hypothetical protein
MTEDLIGRVRRLLVSPVTEWDAIDGEPANMGDIYKGYVIPLVVFAAVCSGIGGLWLGAGILLTIRSIILSVILGLAGVYLIALIIDGLATTFGAQKNFGQAFKVAAYAPTAGWVASVFNIIPFLAIIGLIAGLYSLYLMYLGLPKLMRSPADKAVMYTVTVIACVFVVAVVAVVLLLPLLY